jgi:hypothetical protein
MNKIYNRKGYDFKEDLKDALVTVFWIAVIMCVIISIAWCVDRIDRHDREATVIDVKPLDATVLSTQSLDEQIVTFETADGNTWEYTFDYDREIKPQDKAVLTFKEYEDADVTNDEIVAVKWVE